MTNAINSIAGIDDFADEMKKNLEHKHKLLEFVKKVDGMMPDNYQSNVLGWVCELEDEAEKLLKEIEGDCDEV